MITNEWYMFWLVVMLVIVNCGCAWRLGEVVKLLRRWTK